MSPAATTSSLLFSTATDVEAPFDRVAARDTAAREASPSLDGAALHAGSSARSTAAVTTSPRVRMTSTFLDARISGNGTRWASTRPGNGARRRDDRRRAVALTWLLPERPLRENSHIGAEQGGDEVLAGVRAGRAGQRDRAGRVGRQRRSRRRTGIEPAWELSPPHRF